MTNEQKEEFVKLMKQLDEERLEQLLKFVKMLKQLDDDEKEGFTVRLSFE